MLPSSRTPIRDPGFLDPGFRRPFIVTRVELIGKWVFVDW